MKTFIENNTKNTSHFIVAINQINNSKALLSHVLYTKMVDVALKSVNPFNEMIVSKPKLHKLEILKNAFLNDKIVLKSSIKSLNYNNLQLSVKVFKESKNTHQIICSACFSFKLKGNSLKNVS